MLTPLAKERLLALCDFMESGKGLDEFDYNIFYDDDKGDKTGHLCGTVGCALGHAPLLWPDDWRFVLSIPLHGRAPSPSMSAAIWFDIRADEAYYLFFPGRNDLPSKPSKAHVINHIREYVERGGMPE